jgi:anti-sigma regulatory factor (Ser/Thr protein kinase)
VPVSQARREVVRARLPGRPSSVGVARRLLRSTDPTLGDADVDTAELLVSELVTNAVVHAGTPVDIVVSVVADATLQVEVSDGSGGCRPTAPARSCPYGAEVCSCSMRCRTAGA